MPKGIKAFVLLLLFSSLINCDSNAVYDVYESFPNKWNKDSVASFKFKAPDTINNYNLFINLRNNNDYRFNNLYLIAELNYPQGEILRDTLEYKMAKPSGELLGSGFSDIKENKLWYKGFDKDFKFAEQGEYELKIEHAMRQNGEVQGILNLEGIMEVGFRIERIQE